MAEIVGLTASIITLMSFAGHVVQGGQNLKRSLKNYNEAPQYIKNLVEELELVKESTEGVDKLGPQITSSVNKSGLDAAVKQCLKAMTELTEYISNANETFKKSKPSKRGKTWHSLKIVLNQQIIEDKIAKLSRSREQLLSVQTNLSLSLGLSAGERMEGMIATHGVLLQSSQDSAATLNKGYEVLTQVDDRSKRIEEAVIGLPAAMEKHTSLLMLQTHRHQELFAGMENVMKSVMQEELGQFHLSYSEKTERVPGSCISVKVAEQNCPRFDSPRRGRHFHTKKEILCRNPFLKVSRVGSTLIENSAEVGTEHDEEGISESQNSYRSVTTYDIKINLGLWRRGLEAVRGCFGRTYVSPLDVRLRTYNILHYNAPVFEAAENFDIDTLRALFEAGQASPFDQTNYGASLFDKVFGRLVLKQSSAFESITKGLETLKYVNRCGARPLHSRLEYIFVCNSFYMKKSTRIHWQDAVVQGINLHLRSYSEDPVLESRLPLYLGLDNQNDPICECILRQEYWPLELEATPVITPDGVFLQENDRHVHEDPEGLVLAAHLGHGLKYESDNRYKGLTGLSGIFSVIDMFARSGVKDQIRNGCINRIKLLIEAGYDLRELSIDALDEHYPHGLQPVKVSVVEFSEITSTFDLLRAALHELGWTKSDIESLLDEEKYRGVPELLNGDFQFKSVVDNRDEFLQHLANGTQLSTHWDDIKFQSSCLSMRYFNVRETIDQGARAFKMRRTPGAYIDEESASFTLGVDFFIWCRIWTGSEWEWRGLSSFEEYDYYRERGWVEEGYSDYESQSESDNECWDDKERKRRHAKRNARRKARRRRRARRRAEANEDAELIIESDAEEAIATVVSEAGRVDDE